MDINSFCDIYKSRTPIKVRIFCDVYKLIANNTPKFFKLEELT